MGTGNTKSVRQEFELVRNIKYSNGEVAQWGPSYFVEDKNAAVKQIWSDIDTLTEMHINSTEPFKMTFESGDNPTASFTYHETSKHTNTISWRIETHTKLVE